MGRSALASAPRPRRSAAATTFVFVHGMSPGAFTWDTLVRRLERGGHRALAVDPDRSRRRGSTRAGSG
jgi:hypothetical protein